MRIRTPSIIVACNLLTSIIALCTSYGMSARAIRRILASSPRAAGPRASANITTYSPRTHAITSLLHDEVPIYHAGIVVSAIYYILA